MIFTGSGYRIFSIAGIDVSVSFWFAFLVGIVAFWLPGIEGLLWRAAITLSILVHEFGHAVPSKLFGLRPSILLHGFGGVCMHQPADSDWKDILIIVMGPLVQMAFGVAALAAFFVLVLVPGEYGTMGPWEMFLAYFTFVSLFWGGLNLVLPLFPLDGGQLFHMILRRFVAESKAQRIALVVSLVTAVPIGIFALSFGFTFGAVLVAFIAMGNIQALQHGAPLVDRRARTGASPFVIATFAAVEKAVAQGDWREASRLCHQLRATNDSIPPRRLQRIWEILVLSAANQGDWEEAKVWLPKAPDTAAVREVRARFGEAPA
jgi:Zn-dependent protease